MAVQSFGIDVSQYQGNFDFALAMAAGVKFAILKVGAGKAKAVRFEENYAAAKRLGLPVGAYVYGYDTTVESAIATAKAHINSTLKNRQFEYPIYYDVEGKMLTIPKQQLTSIVTAFCDTLEKAGYYAGIYATTDAFNHHLDDFALKRFTHWVAVWGKDKPVLKSGSRTDMWQFGGDTNLLRSNKIAGVTCDQNYCYVNFPDTIKRAGLNNFEKDVNS